MIPAASHALPMEKPAETGRVIGDFLAGDAAPQTFMAVRRSTAVAPAET